MKQLKFWKRLGLLFVLGLFLSWGVSCSTSSPTSQNRQPEIEFWTMQLQPQFTDYFNQLIANFETENPGLKVKWVDVPWSAMESKVLAAVAAKTAADVINLNPDFAALLAGRNAWLNLNDTVPESVQSQYLPNIWQANKIEVCPNNQCQTVTFGIPWYLTTQITIYNQQLLQQAGISQPPKTYSELAQVAQKVKEKTGKYAVFVSFVPEDSAQVLQSIVQMGAELIDNKGKAAFNTPQGKAAFQYWVDLYQKDLLPKEVLTQGHRRAIELYQSGDIAILTSGPQFLKAIAQNAPTVAKVSVPAPQITGDTKKTTVAVMNLVIPKSTDVPEAAVKFALFVTNSTNQLAFAKAANVLPSIQDALKDSYFTTLPANPTTADQARLVSAQELKNAQVLIPPQKDIKQLQKIIYDNLQAAMLNQKTVDQAIADAEKTWNER
ncbi:MAG: ABC transporter substrate-binding protein [Planktothrix sp.]|jgi:putative chitobiose transport system substrate-binding protein|uniref:ABC transporter substrate-binding protein n=1 Tax=Planktothrix sp. TaxID=3088171 RepID=UPI0038D38A68